MMEAGLQHNSIPDSEFKNTTEFIAGFAAEVLEIGKVPIIVEHWV
jgi:hypothetical protein